MMETLRAEKFHSIMLGNVSGKCVGGGRRGSQEWHSGETEHRCLSAKANARKWIVWSASQL